MRFKGKVIYYIVSQTAAATVKLLKEKVKRNPGTLAAYFAARMLGDLIVPPKKISAVERRRRG